MSNGYQPCGKGKIDLTNPPHDGSGVPPKKSYKIITRRNCACCDKREGNYCTELKKELREPYILTGCMDVGRNEWRKHTRINQF